MEDIKDMLPIPSIDSSTNFWMIRTKRGFFFDEFISEKYIAIGWNLVTRSKLETCFEGDLRMQIQEVYRERAPGSALNKCTRFCYEMKPGDIAAIADAAKTAFAVIGEYYEERDPRLTAGYEKELAAEIERGSAGRELMCPYITRRHCFPGAGPKW